MKEIEFLNTISAKLANNKYLGDDCAYLEEFGLYVTQDTLVEDVHFSLQTTTPEELGWKAAAVNLSDIAASAAVPLYITVSLSLPEDIDINFVEKLYRGLNKICKKYNVAVIGGDLTRSEKVFISICAIGKKISKFNVSRSYAKPDDIVIVTGNHGDSAAGLTLLQEKKTEPDEIIKKHLLPSAQIEKGLELAKSATRDFALMDTSDGLADALYKISKASNIAIDIDFSKIPFNPILKEMFPLSYKELILWGGEDFELVAVIPETAYKKLDKREFKKIGIARKGNDVYINDNNKILCIDNETFSKKSFKHFKEK